MDHNHMLAPASHHREPSSRDVPALGPPPAPPPACLGSFCPPAYSKTTSTNATAPAVIFPDVPSVELPLLQPLKPSRHESDIRLPPLSSLTGARCPRDDDLTLNPPQGQWPPLNVLPAYHAPTHPPPQAVDSPARMDIDTSSNSVTSAASPDRLHDARSTTVDIDDPDVRLAAEALGDLRAGKWLWY